MGPVVGGFTLVNLARWCLFILPRFIALIGALCSAFLLKETNTKDKMTKPADKKRFTFTTLFSTLKIPIVGTAIFAGFLLTLAQFTMIIGFQSYSVDVFKLSNADIGFFYTGFALMGIIMQLCVPLITKWIPTKAMILLLSTLLCFAAMLLSGFTMAFITFAACLFIYGLFNGLRNPNAERYDC